MQHIKSIKMIEGTHLTKRTRDIIAAAIEGALNNDKTAYKAWSKFIQCTCTQKPEGDLWAVRVRKEVRNDRGEHCFEWQDATVKPVFLKVSA